jgi:hypothetical protein
MNKIEKLLKDLANKMTSINESDVPAHMLQDFIGRRDFIQGLTGSEELELRIYLDEEDDCRYYYVDIFIQDAYIGTTSYYDRNEMHKDFAQFNSIISINY